ncbi:hypothetical protein EVAR_25738_1 [Eumeta japonica]|uniref:Uncharacterized protein n=1 Tax=Eumeta variegata TaxID=151549 RepID=A0A4C1VA06_EUMVA|nr:hypothetical protein EVAR_25738_1 [Eumeta japonica]
MSRFEDKAEDLLRSLLKDVCEREGMKDYDIEIEALPCTGSNYTAALFLATIKGDGSKKLDIFAKVANLKENFRKYMPVTEMYKRESFVYQKTDQDIRRYTGEASRTQTGEISILQILRFQRQAVRRERGAGELDSSRLRGR